jgi:glycosyltransferase involved in cell wall biosynthesis
MLVSVIIPAFNAAGVIRRTLNSVLAQTYQTIEVIVVDDGSSDATSAIVEEFVTRDSRVQLVQQSNAATKRVWCIVGQYRSISTASL